jgi:hypothetical protein
MEGEARGGVDPGDGADDPWRAAKRAFSAADIAAESKQLPGLGKGVSLDKKQMSRLGSSDRGHGDPIQVASDARLVRVV